MGRGIFCTLIKRINNDWHWNHSPWPWGNEERLGVQILPEVSSAKEGGAEEKDLFQHLCAGEMQLLSAFASVPGGYLSTLALCRASSTAPLPPGPCKSHNSAFNIVILKVRDFPFSACWSDLIEARSCAGFPAFQMIFGIKHANPTVHPPCFCGIMSAERCHERWHLFTEKQRNIFCRMWDF